MRRREKFVISSILLTLGLWLVQLVSLDYRYLAVGILGVVSYILSLWALSGDLQLFEFFTIAPFPALYAMAVGLFYFLLPENILTKMVVLSLFGIGMYAIFLAANIYSVAKGRTIQLIHAAHAVSLLMTVMTSLLFTNAIFSLKLPFYLNALLVGGTNFPLILMSLWSIKIEQEVGREVIVLSLILTMFLVELAILLSFFPLSVWNSALFLMAFLYIGLGLLHNFLRGILFKNALREYSLVAVLVAILFILYFPLK